MLSFVQLGPGSQNLTFQEKEIFIYRSKNENKIKKNRKVSVTMYNLSY